MILASLFSSVLLLAPGPETIPPFTELLAHPVRLKPELVGVHPRHRTKP